MEPRTSRNNRMERSRHVEDVSSSDEPDLKRPVSDNSAPTTRKRESILKNVMVLFSCDVRKRDGKVYMPNTIEMARLKRPERGQFKTNIEFIKTMTEKDVKEKLRRHFSILGNNGRLSCATAADNRTRLEFHCSPQTVWDGNKINRHIRGNSALYVLCEGTPESVSERPESSTVDSFLQQLQTPTPEPMGSPLAYSGKLQSLKRKHYSSSSSVPEVVPNRGASVKKQGLKQSSGGDYSKESQEVNNLKTSRYIESNNSSDSAFESSIVDASGVDDNTEHSNGKIKEAACSRIAQLERYLQNSEMDPSEGSSWEEIDLNRSVAGDQMCLSDRELNEAYQDVQEMFSPVIKLLCPDEGPITGGTKFVVCLNARRIPENLTSLRALFNGVGFADLTLVTEGVYTGRSPASKKLGKVAVTVGSLDGTWNTLDEKEFEYHPNVTQELQKLISKMPDTKRNIPLDYQTLNPACSAGTVSSPSSFSPEVDKPLMADESKDILSLKALQCILFAAAATNDRECIEIIFSTSGGEAVFQTYRNSSILPEDTARAKGHQNLAEYLQNVHKRLSREIVGDVQNVTIDWLELKRATAKKDIFSGTDESQGLELEMENDDDQSSYFADDETSICQSPSTTEFSNEDECIESKYTDDAEMLEHSRCENNHGDAYDKFQLSLPSVDEVFEFLNDDQVKSANGMVKCKAVLHSQKRFGFTITAPLSEAAQGGTSKSHEEPHGSKLSAILRRNPEFMEELCFCLDREMKFIRNWRGLASKFLVDLDVIRRLGRYDYISPTIRLFDFLATSNPDLTIKELRDILLEIERSDLISLLIKKAGCADNKKVFDVITSPSDEAPSPTVGLLDEIALALDGTSLVLSNWYTLALKLGVPRKTCWKFERRSTENPTGRLFQHLATTCPQKTLLSLREALDSVKRKDLVKFLHDEELKDDMLLKDVITPGSKLLKRLALELNQEDNPVVKNWTHLAWKMEVPADVYRMFADVKQKWNSPTKEVLEWVSTQFSEIALSDVAKALDDIQRNDAIQIISKHFPDTIDSFLEGLGCPFTDSFSMPDKTRQMFSITFEREERDSSPIKVAEVQEQCGHCGNLPDRTDLAGRNETCERIINALSSNRTIEIVAPPGYGKTSVVIEVAHRMIERKTFVAYVKSQGVTCVEDLASKIIETLGYVPGENTITEVLSCISSLKRKSVLIIIENIDNLLHLEDKVSNDKYHQELKSESYRTEMLGKFTKDDFLTFLKDLGQSSNIQLVLTSRETCDFNVSFPVELINLEPLNDDDSASMFSRCEDGLNDDLIKDLVRVCGGIPLIICTAISILKRENPRRAARRLSTSTPSSLVKELNPDDLPNENRIDKCLQICFDRLSQENQRIIVMFSTFPHRFTQEQFQEVFRSFVTADLRTCLNSLEHSSLLHFDRISCQYSLHPFIRDFLSLKSDHIDAKSTFIRHYSDFVVALCETFLSKDCKSAIDQYRSEKDNIREAMAWCGDDHPELDQTFREQCIEAFNEAAVFLAKVMRKQEFQSLFREFAYRCRTHLHLYSACLTNIGMKTVLSCTCTPHICQRALYQAREVLTHANDIHSLLMDVKESTRAQCMSKFGFCYVREGRVYEGYEYLQIALELRRDRVEKLNRNKDHIMLAACFNDVAASQMVQRNHMMAIQTRLLHVLPVYEENLGDHPFTATTLSWIGNSYYALGDYENAIKYSSRSISIRRQLLGLHQETAKSLYDLGVAFSAKQDYETALEYLKEAIDYQEKLLDTRDELIHSHQAMSIALRALGRDEEAEEEMNRAGECARKLDSWEAPLD